MKFWKFGLVFLLILFQSLDSKAQISPECGLKIYKGDATSTDSSIREFVKIKALPDGSLIHAGQADEGADANVSLTKTNSDGTIIWQKTIEIEQLDVLKNFCITSDGGFVLVGWTASLVGTEPSDALIIRCDSQGNVIWVKAYGGSDDDEGFNATQLPGGDFLITGTTYSFGPNLRNAFAVRLNPDGEVVWSKAFAKGTYNYFIDAFLVSADEIILCGYTWVTSGTSIFDPWFVKIQGNGQVIWSKWLKMNNSQIIYDFEKDADGGIVYAGVSTTSGANQNLIGKVSASGNHLWAKLFGTNFGDRIWDMAISPWGNYLVAGFTDKSGAENAPRNGFVARLSNTGNVEAAAQFTGGNDTSTTTFTGITTSGDFLVANGFSYAYGNTQNGSGISAKLPIADFSQSCGAGPITIGTSTLAALDSAGISVEDGGSVSTTDDVNSSENNLLVQTICTVTGISKTLNQQSDFLVFPNPAEHFIQISSIVDDLQEIRIFGSDGRVLTAVKGVGKAYNLDLDSFRPGLYWVQIRTRQETKTISFLRK
jgi:hypothetical protein